MDIFEDIGYRIHEAGRMVKDAVRVAVLKKAASDQERSKQKLFADLGEAYYQQHKDGGEGEFSEQIWKIKEVQGEIYGIHGKIEQIRAMKHIPGNVSTAANRRTGVAVLAVLAFIMVALTLFAVSGRSYRSTVDQFFNASFEADAAQILELAPEKVAVYLQEEAGFDSLEEMIKDANKELQKNVDSLDRYLGDDWEVDVEITNVEVLTNQELADVEEMYEDFDLKVSNAKMLEVEFVVRSEQSENSTNLEIPVVKIGRNWYLNALEFNGLF